MDCLNRQYDRFSDPSHLNQWGATEVSRYLSQTNLIPWRILTETTTATTQPISPTVITANAGVITFYLVRDCLISMFALDAGGQILSFFFDANGSTFCPPYGV